MVQLENSELRDSSPLHSDFRQTPLCFGPAIQALIIFCIQPMKEESMEKYSCFF